jgi:SWI/SNF-related matrix-associated actin-dependent regulator 1 of chromatin subfamily A
MISAYGKWAVVSGSAIELTFREPTNEEFVKTLTMVKTIPGREFNGNAKTWKVPKTAANIEKLKAFGFEFKEGAATRAVKTYTLPEWNPPYLEMPTPAEWKELFPGLRDYQLTFLKFMQWREGFALLGDEMGTGKTCQALSWAKLFDQWPILVVTTASTKDQWGREFRKWVGKGTVQILSGKTPYRIIPSAKMVVINWDILASWRTALIDHGFYVLVGDEAHAIANPEAQRTVAFSLIAKKVKSVLAMSGTPILTKPRQFFPVLHLLEPQLFPTERKFLYRYCDPKPGAFGMTFDGATHIEELHDKIRRIMLRRLKSDVIQELPEKIRTTVFMEVDHKVLEEAELSFLASLGGTRAEAELALSELSTGIFTSKKDAVLRWLGEFSQSGEKLVIFVWHRAVGDWLAMELGKSAVRVDGSSTGKDREAAIRAFTTKAGVRFLIGNILAAGVGIDGLQHVCSNCAFVEFTASPGFMDQAESRLHRMGQKNSVNIWYLAAQDSVESDQLELLQNRWHSISTILDGQTPNESNLPQLIKSIKGRRHGKNPKN